MCAKKTAATTKIVTPAAKQRAMSKTIDKKPMEADKKQLTASKKKKSELISSEASNSKILSRATPAKAPTAKPPKTAKPVGDEKINEANKVVKLPSAKPNDAKANTIDPDKSCGNNKLNRMSDTKTNAKSDEIKSKNNKSKLDCNADKSLVKPNEKVDDNTKNSDKTEVTGTVKKVVAKSKAKPDKLGVQSKISPKPKFINVKKKVVKKREPKIKISKELKNLGVELSKSSAIAASPTSTSSDVKTSICEMVKTKTRTPNYFGKPSASVQGDDAKAKKLNKDAKPKPDKQPKSDSGKKSEAPVAAELSAVLPAETVKNAAACNVKSKKAVPKAVKSEVEVKVAESLEKIVEPIITEKLIADEPKKILSPPVSVVTTPKKKCNPKKIDLKVNSDNSEVKSSEISVLPKKVRKYNKKKSLEADPNLTSSEVKKLPPEKSKTRKYVKKKMKDSNLLETESKTVNIAKEPKAKKQKSKPIAAVEPLEKDLKIVQKEEVVEDEQEIETVKIIMKDVEELIVKNVHEVSKLFELVPINNGLHFDGILKPLAAPVLKNPFNTESVKIEKLKRKYVRKNFNPKLQSKTISKPSKSPNKVLGSKLIKLKKHSSSKTNHSDSSIKVIALHVESEDQKPNNLVAQPEPIKDIKVKTPVKTLKQESSETQSDIKKEVHTPTIIPIPPPKKENKYEKTSEAANKKKMAAKILEPTKEVVGIKDECIEKMIVAKIIEKVASNKSTEDTKNVEQKLSPIKKVEQKVSTPKKVIDQKPLTPKKVEQKPATPKKVDQKPITPKKSEQKSPVSKKIEQKPLTQKKYDQDPLKTESSDNNLESDSEDNYSESGYTKPKRQAVRTSVRNRKHKQKQMCPKRSRVASLNAMAKVHCLYENESRSALETNLFNAEKISQATQRIKQNAADSGSSEGDDNDESESTKAPDEKRSLRTQTGMVGKHWEMEDSMTSEESNSDVTDKNSEENADKTKKKGINKKQSKPKNLKKLVKKSPKHSPESDDDTEEDTKTDAKIKKSAKKPKRPLKRKQAKEDDKSVDKHVIMKKRMASLNASAILAASYEADNYTEKQESETNSESESSQAVSSRAESTIKKEKKEVVIEIEETRPKSTSVVTIDTDVTITGVYVNTSAVSSNETYCKRLQYRTAYSVTEERVVTQEIPPKSYTPLTALSSMRPPDPSLAAGMPFPPQPPMCETPLAQGYIPPYHQPPQSLIPPHAVPSTSSAFYAPHQPMGYYPSGPLIPSHLLPPQQQTSSLSLSDQHGQSVQSSSSNPDSAENDVLIAGGDLSRSQYRYGPPDPSLYSRPVHQMHCQPSYAPNYFYGQAPPQEMCYPPQAYQPYYQPKMYPSSPPFRRYPPNYYPPQGSDLYDRQHAVPPPQSGPQLVPPGPSGHYPAPSYYSSYSPSGQCYSHNIQPPYLDPQQHFHHSSSCPCPMQSCPKNVQAGPLIGIKTSKGPVLASQQNLQLDTPFTLTSASGAPSNKKVSCKIENILGSDIVIKPENDNSSIQTDCANKQTTYDKVALAPQPNYSINAQVLEQEHSTSPARGSTGLQLPPVHCEALQPIETNFSDNSSLGNHISSQRKARLGKSTERERQYMIMSGYQPTTPNEDFHSTMFKHEVKQEACVKKEKDYEEDVVECIDDSNEVILEKVKVEKESPTPQIKEFECQPATPRKVVDNTIDLDASNDSMCKRRLSIEDDVIDLSDSSSAVHDIPIMKRRKLLEKPPTPKQSPPNSYKRLIKAPTNPPKSYLANSSKSKLISANMSRISSKVSIKRKNMLKNKRNARIIAKNKKKIAPTVDVESAVTVNGKTDEHDIVAIVNDEKKIVESLDNKESNEVPEDSLNVANIDLTIDRVAKGYFSESEILSKVLKKRLNKKQEKRSHSETTQAPATPSKKPQKLSKKKLTLETKGKDDKASVDNVTESPAPTVNNNSNDCEDKNQNISTKSKAPKPRTKNIKDKEQKGKKNKPEDSSKAKNEKIKKKIKKLSDNDNSSVDGVVITDDSSKVDPPVTPKRKYVKKSSIKISEKEASDQPIVIESQAKEAEMPSNQLITETIDTIEPAKLNNKPLLKDADVTNNNDEYFEDNNKATSLSASTTAICLKGVARRSRKSKFGNRRRQKLPSLKELDDFVKPERTSSNPRWSNGWTWEGEPFKAYVFLNSDDAPVVRTCYASMRHQEGDTIRPRDCVLLKAGTKRFELPYVAKVAQLWENPEDGEMMMSLFWYYRPEHTEQGRLPVDAADEVFASRHKDHNSVACIEDKCYVLTFIEYCRYRRQLKCFEENLEEPPSLVPKMPNYDTHRQVPTHTSPDLVMFCHRVYDFRLKRLLQNKLKS